MRQPLVTGNWKMNGSQDFVRTLLNGLKQEIGSVHKAEVAVCPPFMYIPLTAELLQGTPISWGAQNLSTESAGAFTGEIAGNMLTDFGCKYVIIGHSERRSLYGESSAIVAQKFSAAQQQKLTPILCVGELLKEREAGQTEAVVSEQLDAVIQHAGISAFANAVIAYEPVWAIGTGKTATPQQAQEVHAFIRQRLAAQDVNIAQAIRILYGGSMKPDNASELIAQEDIDGGLIGGAALKAADFLAICTAAN